MTGARFASLALFASLFLPLIAASGTTGATKERIAFEPSGVSVLAERADSAEKRSRGLMYRASLGEKEGMIFYFDEADYHAFWMFNTRIPLTVIFLNDGLRIVDIRDMVPCREKNPDLCPIYASRGLARYALEVNRGFTERYGVKVGDHVTIEKVRRP